MAVRGHIKNRLVHQILIISESYYGAQCGGSLRHWLFSALPWQVERSGKPTWRRLVEAVEDRVGGNNHALAQRIAREHPAGVLP